MDSVAEGIYQVRLPLPFALNSVNCYLLRGSSGWTIIDTGINTPAAQQGWLDAFTELDIKITDVEKIVLTHAHPDHFGLGGWLQNLAADANYDLPIFMSSREHLPFGAHLWNAVDRHHFADYLTFTGVPQNILDEVADSMAHTMQMTFPALRNLREIQPGDPIQLGERTFQMFHTPGHSDGHMIFYDVDDHLLLSGDHVLMKITPNIGLWSQSDKNPLFNYLHTLKELQKLDVRLALPGHKTLITDWSGRLNELYDHHLMRLERTLEAVEKGLCTAYEATHHIFDISRFTVHEWRFAVAETLAHTEYLHHNNQLVRHDEPIWRYSLP